MIGSVIGTYRVTACLGTGGMGTVYQGVDEMLDRPVAIKVLKPELVANPQLIERFRTEAVLLGKLNHPNIATLYGFLPIGPQQFAMVMEFLAGTSLETLLRQRGALPLSVAVPLFAGVLDAIGYAHRQGIIHRDIKPSNVMVLPDGTPKVMDFGIARAIGSSHQTRVGAIVGTLEYMSPEQIQGKETDARSDIYSLGILLYEILTGRVPFAADSEYALLQAHIQSPPPPPRVFAPQIPEAVAQIVLRALEKDPNRRFQTAEEFKLALVAATTPSLATIPGDVRVVVSMPGTRSIPTPPVYPLPGPAPPVRQTPLPQPAWSPTPVTTKPNRPWLKIVVWSLASVAALVFILATLAYVWVHRGVSAPESRAPATSRPPNQKESVPIPSVATVPSPSDGRLTVTPEPEHPVIPPPSQPKPPVVSVPEIEPPQSDIVPTPEPPIQSEEVAPKKQPKRPGKDRSAISERERRRREALKALDQ